MRRRHLAAMLVIAGFAIPWSGLRPAASEPAPPRGPDGVIPFELHRATLDNGLRVVIVPMAGTGLVGYRTAIRTGSRDEYEPGRTGFAHFFEHMMFRGTQKYPEDKYQNIMTRIGADTNAYTSTDVTVYLINIAAEDLEQIMELESDRFQNLSYAEQAFQTEAGAVYGEYRKGRTSPFFRIYEALQTTAFDRHTYGHTTIGTEDDIKAMPTLYDYSKQFFARYYRPDNAILVIAGDVDPDDTIAKVKRYYGGWKPGYVPPAVQTEPPQTAERRVEVAYEGRALPMISIGYKVGALAPGDRVWVASRVLAELAFGETSEIYRRLVLDEQIAQRISASPSSSRDPGLWTVNAVVVDAKDIDRVMAAIDETVARFRAAAPDAARVQAVKSHLRYQFIMGLDSPANVAGRLAHMAGVGGGIDAIEQMYRTLGDVTPADVQAAASEYLVSERRTVAVLRGKE